MGKPIPIYVGVCTAFKVNLEKADFSSVDKYILTIKNKADVSAPVIIEREFTTAEITPVTIKPEESVLLTDGAIYDFNKILKADGSRHAVPGSLGAVVLIKGAGGCIG